MLSVQADTYDVRDPLIIHRFASGTNLDSRERRTTRTKTLDGSVSIYDGGYADGDRTFTVVAANPTDAQITRARQLNQENTSVIISAKDGIYSGVVSTTNIQSDGSLKLTILVSTRLDS